MRRALGGLMFIGAGVAAPSVIVWWFGAPWWGWLSMIGALVVVGLISFIVANVIEWLGPDGALCVGIVLMFLLVMPVSLGFPWWGGFAVAGGIVGFLGLLRIAFEGLLMMIGADEDAD